MYAEWAQRGSSTIPPSCNRNHDPIIPALIYHAYPLPPISVVAEHEAVREFN